MWLLFCLRGDVKKNSIYTDIVQIGRGAQHGGGWGGTIPHEGAVPPHQSLSPPIQKNLSPPPWIVRSPPEQKFSARFARNSLIIGKYSLQ